jgi:hypothetical protein
VRFYYVDIVVHRLARRPPTTMDQQIDGRWMSSGISDTAPTRPRRVTSSGAKLIWRADSACFVHRLSKYAPRQRTAVACRLQIVGLGKRE